MSCPLVRLSFNSALPFSFKMYHSISKADCQYLAFNIRVFYMLDIVFESRFLYSIRKRLEVSVERSSKAHAKGRFAKNF